MVVEILVSPFTENMEFRRIVPDEEMISLRFLLSATHFLPTSFIVRR
jgi:hypothetical protein